MHLKPVEHSLATNYNRIALHHDLTTSANRITCLITNILNHACCYLHAGYQINQQY
jgi:hypothetical protein